MIPDLLLVPLGCVLLVVSAAAFAISGFNIMKRMFDGESLLTRTIAGILFSIGVMLASMTLLLFVGLFSKLGLLLVAMILLVVQRRSLGTAVPLIALREKGSTIIHSHRRTHPLIRVLVMLGLFCFTFQCLRGMMDPPLSWDSLTYHLALPALWIQNSGHAWLRIPDAFDCYSHFMHNGEVAAGWLMIPFSSDLLVNLMNAPTFVLMMLCLLGIGREIGIGTKDRLWLPALVLFTPPLFAYITTQYVEPYVAVLEICAAYFFLMFYRTGKPAECVAAFVAVGIAAGTKPMALPFAVFSVLIMLILAMKHRMALPALVKMVIIAGCVSLAFCAPWFIRNMMDTGSPLYPFQIGSAEASVFEGSRYMAEESQHVEKFIENAQLTNADVYRKATDDAWAGAVTIIYGPRLPLMIGLGALGLILGIYKSKRRGALILLTSFMLLELLLYLSPAMSLARLVWAEVALRFTVFPFAVFCIGSVLLLSYAKGVVRNVLVFLFALCFVVDLTYMNTQHGGGLTVPVILGVLSLVLVFLTPRLVTMAGTGISRKQVGVAMVIVIIMMTGVQAVRDSTRYAFYNEHVDLHVFPRKHVKIWESLDVPTDPQVIAVTAGYRYYGHNWFIYPVMGRRLQNTVRYISPVAEGTMSSYTPGVSIYPVSPAEWIQRVKDSDAQIFYVMHGGTLEEGWARQAPETFTLLYEGRDTAIFQIQR